MTNQYKLGEITQYLVDNEGFKVEIDSEVKQDLTGNVERQKHRVTLLNSKGRTFETCNTNKGNVQYALDRLEKYARDKFNFEYDKARPFETMERKIRFLTDSKFYNNDKHRLSRRATYNGYDLVFSAYKDDSNLPKIEIWQHQAGNTILEFCPFSKNSILSNRGSININPSNFSQSMVSTIGELLLIIRDYLESDLEVRLSEWNNKYGSDWTIEKLDEAMDTGR